MIGKCLIVDDEAWFREGLMHLINSNQLGWEVAGEAGDGEEALAMIEQCKPDLVIADINMPMMDGLELTRLLSMQYPDVMVVILTGYREFEYAQRALRYGVEDYLLKPVSFEDAYRVLRKAYEHYRLHELQSRVLEQERQTELFRAAVYGLPCDPILSGQWEQKWTGSEFCILKVQTYYPADKNYTPKDTGLLHYAVTKFLQELMEEQELQADFFALHKDRFAFVMEPGQPGQLFREKVIMCLQQYIGLTTNWHGIAKVVQFDQLHALYAQDNSASGSTQEQPMPAAGDPLESLRLKEELTALLVTSDREQAKKRLDEYIDRAAAHDLHKSQTMMYTLVRTFADILKQEFRHLEANRIPEPKPSEILAFRSVPDLVQWGKSQATEFVQLYVRLLEEQRGDVVVQAKTYIHQNYRDSCTLQSVASHVHVSPNYLSSLFKKETGIGFPNYVNQIRIEKAQSLLQHTRLRMTDIAEQVGFDNASYFTSVFKQLTGQSPRDYRNRQPGNTNSDE